MIHTDSMEYRRSGQSGLLLPWLTLGGWHNFDRYDRTRDLTLCALNQGITHIDLANNYGPPPGIAETHFGLLMHRELRLHRDEMVVSTKAGYHMWKGPYGEWGSRKHVLASLDQSLQRLRLSHVDIFYSHRFDPNTPLEETMGALHSAVVSGKAIYPGISNYPPEAIRKAAGIMRALGTPLVIHQCSYSMINRRIEKEIIPATREEGLGMIVFSPLSQGLLTNRYLEGIPEDSRASRDPRFLRPERITPPLQEFLRKLNQWASQRHISLARLALQWCLRDRDSVTSVLIGASRPDQITENLQSLQPELGPEDWQDLDQLLAQIP